MRVRVMAPPVAAVGVGGKKRPKGRETASGGGGVWGATHLARKDSSASEVGVFLWGLEAGASSFSETAMATAVIEVDEGRLVEIDGDPGVRSDLEAALRAHGLALRSIRAFRSGSVAKLNA